MFGKGLPLAVAALLALVAASGSHDRGPLRVTSDIAASQPVNYAQLSRD